MTIKELKKLKSGYQEDKTAREKAWAKYKKLYADDRMSYHFLPEGHRDDPSYRYPMNKAEVAKYKDLDTNKLYMKKKNSNQYVEIDMDNRHTYALDSWAGTDIVFWAHNPNHDGDDKDES